MATVSVLVVVISFMEDLKAIATLLGLVGAAIVIALQVLWAVVVERR